MHRLFYILFITLFVTACGPTDDEKANKYLISAEHSFAEGDYNMAKLQIDSIKLLYPKAFETRKAGNRFMLKIEQEEQLRSLINLDSLEQVQVEEFNQLKGKYFLDKNAEYQEIGNYIIAPQRIENNMNKTYLRFQVDETGKMSFTAIYSGSRGIGLRAIKVATPDGTYAETPESTDTFASTNLGVTSEKADYKYGNDGDVIPFILNNLDKKLTVTFIGDRNYTYTMSNTEKKAAEEISKLTIVLHTITELNNTRKEAELKLKFVEGRMAKMDSLDNEKSKDN